MVKLLILGSPDLRAADGNPMLSVLHRPKRLALLSYLAVEGLGGYLRRDRLLGLFWPETEERKARSSLSEALSRLRQSLGPDVILTRGNEEIGLSADRIWCDAADILEAGTSDADLKRVAELYRGPLLDGFFLDESLAFDHWLDSTRGRMERIALQALGRLTDAAAASGDASSITWAERAVALCPSDGPSVGRLMRLQARAGHRTVALDAFERYARRLADERGLAPSEDLVDLAARIRTGELPGHARASAPKPPSQPTQPTGSRAALRLMSGGADAVVDTPDIHGTSNVEELALPLGDVGPAEEGRHLGGIRRAVGPWKTLTIALAAASVALGGVAVWSLLSEPTMPIVRSEITPTDGSGLMGAPGGVGFTLSPNGQRLVYVGQGPEGRQLWERRLDDLEPTAVPGTDGAASPVFSPDGSSVLFFQDNSLKAVSLAGGLPFTVVDGLEGPPFLDWGPNGLIYYADGGRIYRVPAEGGSPEQVTTEFEGASARLPDVLPDDRGLLVTLRKDAFNAAIGVVGPAGGEIRELFPGTTARYAASGHVVYATLEGALMAAPFDLQRLVVTGSPATLLEGIPVSRSTSAALWTLSASGTVVYRTVAIGASYQVVWVDRLGRVTEIDPTWTFGGDGRWSSLALSPSGDRLAVSHTGAGVDLWIKRLDGGPAERFTFDGRGNHRPAWSPDGDHLIFVHDRTQGEWELGQKRADGTGQVSTLVEGAVGTALYSRDGQWLVYSVETSSSDIFALRVGVDSVGRALLASAAHEFNPRLSPDGRWLAYSSNETGRFEVYVRSFPDVSALKRQVSTTGGTEVVWSRSGAELFYRNGADELIAVDVMADPAFSVGRQTRLFSAAGFLGSPTHPIYDVRRDGQAFVMLREAVAGQPARLMLVQNLFAR